MTLNYNHYVHIAILYHWQANLIRPSIDIPYCNMSLYSAGYMHLKSLPGFTLAALTMSRDLAASRRGGRSSALSHIIR